MAAKTPEQLLGQYMKALRPIIYINHFDFESVDRIIEKVGITYFERRGYNIVEFSESGGWVDFKTKNTHDSSVTDLAEFLQLFNTDQFNSNKKETIVVLKEIHESLRDKRVFSALQAIARRKSMADDRTNFYRVTVIIVDTKLMIPPEIEKLITVVEIRPPDEEEIKNILEKVVGTGKIPESDLRDLTMALSGLSEFEITQIARLAYTNDGKINKDDLSLIFEEKRQAIQKSGLLELVSTSGKVDLGDFDNLTEYLDGKKRIFKNLAEARAHGVDSPSGLMLVGMPGCGKSLSASCVAKMFDCPLLKLDIGRLLGKYVGESEENLRKAIQVAEAASPCILWIDEIEKAFAGASGGEVMTRMFGYFLTWMQEKQAPVYVLATANNISGLPPEFTRRGRFDEIFKVDLPTCDGIAKIFEIHIKKRSQGVMPNGIDTKALARLCENGMYSGADIASIVKEAAEIAYLDPAGIRNIRQSDLETLIKKTVSSCKSQEKNETFQKMVQALKTLDSKPVSKFK